MPKKLDSETNMFAAISYPAVFRKKVEGWEDMETVDEDEVKTPEWIRW